MKTFKSILLISVSVLSILAFRGIGAAVTNPATTTTQLADDLDINFYSLLNAKGIMGIRNAAEFSSIQAAIDDVYSSDGGGLVYVPPGTWTINTGIMLKDNIALVGAGWSTILKQADYTDANVIGSGIGLDFPFIPAKNVVVANLQIDGNKANQSPTDPYDDSLFLGILFNGMTNARIENVYIHDTYFGGISLFQSHNSVVRGNLIYDVSGVSQSGLGCGIEIDLGASNNRIIGNRIHNSGDHGIWMNSGGAAMYGNIISHNIITNSRLRGISVGSDKMSFTTERTIIANNQIANCGSEGISLFVGDGSVPHDPTPKPGYESTLYNTIVMNNLVMDNGATSAAEGIYISTRNPDSVVNTLVGAATIVQSNIVRGSGAEGIRLGMFSEDTIAADNIVLDNTSAQIYDLGIRTVLSGNKDSAASGLTVKRLVGLSAGQTQSNNLRGSETIVGSATSTPVTFTTPETDGSYFVTAIVSAVSGTPANDARRAYVTGKTYQGFTINTEAAPGAGNSVTVDWHLIR